MLQERRGSSSYTPQSGEWCVVCRQRLYLTHRDSAYGYFFHRGCFRCAECGTMLRTGNSFVMRDDEGNREYLNVLLYSFITVLRHSCNISFKCMNICVEYVKLHV